MIKAVAILVVAALAGCATTPTTQQQAQAMYPGVDDPNNGLTTQQRLELLGMEYQSYQQQNQATQEIWNRMAPPPVYIIGR